MRKKYDDAIRRMKDIRNNLNKAANDFIEDDDAAIVKMKISEAAAIADYVLFFAAKAIEGENASDSDYDAACSMLKGASLAGALIGLAFNAGGE